MFISFNAWNKLGLYVCNLFLMTVTVNVFIGDVKAREEEQGGWDVIYILRREDNVGFS